MVLATAMRTLNGKANPTQVLKIIDEELANACNSKPSSV